MKSLGVALVLLHGYAAEAAVTFEKQKNQKSTLTFTGIDLNRFHVINQILSSENSPIASKCFMRPSRGEFGEPSTEKACVILFRNNIDISEASDNGFIKIKDDSLSNGMKALLESQPILAGTIRKSHFHRFSGRTGGTGDAGSTGSQGIFFFDIYRADVQTTGILAGDFFCVDRAKWKLYYNVKPVSGCFIQGQTIAKPKQEGLIQLQIDYNKR